MNNTQAIPYPIAWKRPDQDTQDTIQRLLKLKLSRFEHGYCLGLLGNSDPSPRQRETLTNIVKRYPLAWDNRTKQYEHTPQRTDGECAAE